MTANEPVEKDQEPMSRDHHPPGRSPRARPPSPYEILLGSAGRVTRRTPPRLPASTWTDVFIPIPTRRPASTTRLVAPTYPLRRSPRPPGVLGSIVVVVVDRCPTDCGPPSASSSAGVGDRHGCVERPVKQVREVVHCARPQLADGQSLGAGLGQQSSALRGMPDLLTLAPDRFARPIAPRYCKGMTKPGRPSEQQVLGSL